MSDFLSAAVRCIVAGLLLTTSVIGAETAEKAAGDRADWTDEDFAFQGEYSGEIGSQAGKLKLGVQVVALGKGKFDAVAFLRGLPGDGWDGSERQTGSGELTGGAVTFQVAQGTGVIKDGSLSVQNSGGDVFGTLNKVERKSTTLGAKPPEGAVVLFDGKSADAWEGGRVAEDGLLMPGTTSKQKFGACEVHIEFRLPYQPEARGQARGNSGIYLQGRYEVQMLDSFGLKGENNECGGIYTVRAPDVNMCFPPLAWQTYDISYVPAEYADGKKTKPARMTVRHNGVLIHENVDLPNTTNGAPSRESEERGPIYLQDHGNPVRYRNIWVVEK